MRHRRPRDGFTLVELLVVVTIVVLLYGAMLVRMSPTKGGQCREGANALAESIAEAWSRGLGNPAGSAIYIESAGATAASLAASSVPPPIEGTVLGPMGATFPTSVSVGNATDPAGLANGYRIQFYRTGSGAAPPSPWFGYAGGSVFLRAGAGQTADNTILPVGDNLQCRVLCRPVKAERVMTLPKGVAIDLRYSGLEGSGLGSAASQDIAIMFDAFGGLSGLLVGSDEWSAAPLYLLVAAVNDIDRTDSTPLSSPYARWVVVAPQTGRVTVAMNEPQPIRAPAAVTAADISNARLRARPAASIGR